jgi:hypothetical protein
MHQTVSTVTLEVPGAACLDAVDVFLQELLWDKSLGAMDVFRLKVGALCCLWRVGTVAPSAAVLCNRAAWHRGATAAIKARVKAFYGPRVADD